MRAQLLLTLGEIARNNGDTVNAEALIDESIRRQRELGILPTSPAWIAALVSKGNLLHSTNRSREADVLMQELLPHIESVDTEDSISALMLYGVTRAYAGDSTGGAAVARQALAKAQRVFGPDSSDAIETATYLGQLCSSLRRYRDSEAILEEAMGRWRRLELPMNEQFARSLFHLAVSKHRLGKLAEVEGLFREGIALMRSVQEGPFHRLSQGLVGYATFLNEINRFDDARAALDEALASDLATYGPDHVRTATTLNALAALQLATQDFTGAGISSQMALEVLERHAKDSGYEPELILARLQMSRIALALGREEEATAWQSGAMPELERLFGASSTEFGDGLCAGARIARAAGDINGAMRSVEQVRRLGVAPQLLAAEDRALLEGQ